MAIKPPKIDLRTSPYIRRAPSVPQIMRNVVYALIPLVIYSLVHFGISAFALILVALATLLGSANFFDLYFINISYNIYYID